MNRRGFFAALLAPLVVPWKAKELSLMEQLDRIWEALPAVPWGTSRLYRRDYQEAQRHLNFLTNQMIDNITLSLP